MFLYYVSYFLFMVVIYVSVPVLAGDLVLSEGIVKIYGVLNIIFLFTVIWWNARKHFYFVWAGYLLLLAGYFGISYPNAQWFLTCSVFVTTCLIIAVTFYDVVISRCKGIYRRTQKRYSTSKGK